MFYRQIKTIRTIRMSGRRKAIIATDSEEINIKRLVKEM